MLRALLISLCLFSVSIPCAGSDRLTRMVESSVRVSARGGTGTGGIIAEDDSHYYILTNKHVVENNLNVAIEFVKNHQLSPKLRGQVIGSKLIPRGSFDVALVAVSKSNFSIPMTVMPLLEGEPTGDEVLYALTSGAQAGAQPSIQPVLFVHRDGQMIYYTPTSLPGRSGSLLVDVKTRRTLGCVAWHTRKDGKQVGLAMSTKRIRQWVNSILAKRQGNVNIPVAVPVAIPMDSSTTEIPLARPVSFPTSGGFQCTPGGECAPFNPNSPFVNPGEGTSRGWPNLPGPELGELDPPTRPTLPTPPTDPSEPRVSVEEFEALRSLVYESVDTLGKALQETDKQFKLLDNRQNDFSLEQVNLLGRLQDFQKSPLRSLLRFPTADYVKWSAVILSVFSLILHWLKRRKGLAELPISNPEISPCENCSKI